jgi:hypothetical protein
LWRQATHSKYTNLITPASGAAHLCPSSRGDLPAINLPQIEPQWIHLFQQKAAAPNHQRAFSWQRIRNIIFLNYIINNYFVYLESQIG